MVVGSSDCASCLLILLVVVVPACRRAGRCWGGSTARELTGDRSSSASGQSSWASGDWIAIEPRWLWFVGGVKKAGGGVGEGWAERDEAVVGQGVDRTSMAANRHADSTGRRGGMNEDDGGELVEGE